ncbi:hypothetical protein OIU80_18215 [Flavobacterium sp. LS1R47]|uniref:Outer membrane protein beta-barrel domain-containing protein n=1 Tax=Flavobacterium frigoritolerans TaxID=2987686 RepID=A0A9X3HMS1_9FLAO|nr:hypothetical protein [Flavobacterium frigoritolerans]MCV9934222.1 hypothetical protein [Flavobacterium frigoritolerans]
MKKKKIEDVFSSIENFSSVPPPELWAMIEEKLDKPKKKKATAIWWSLAASLLIGLAITSGLYFNSNEDDTLIKNNNVVLDNQENNSKSNTTPSTINTTPLNSKTTITVAESDNPVTNKTLNKNQESTKNTTTSINKKNKPSIQLNNKTISIAESSKNNAKTSSSKVNSTEVDNNLNRDKNAIITSSNVQSTKINESTSSASPNKTEVGNTINKNKTETIVSNNNTQSSSKNGTNNSSADPNNTKIGNTINKNKTEAIALNSNIRSASQNDTNSSLYKQNITEVNSNLKTDQKKELALNTSSEKDLISFNDSLNKVQIALELQQLENRLNNKEDKEEPKAEKDLLKEKWSVGLYAGIVNSQSYGNKKTLGNDIESKQNTGYGVKTNYKLNKKWAVSSGFKINELGQSVANVSYYNKNQNTLAAGITNDFFASNPSVEYISTNRNYVFSSDNSNQKVQSSGTSNLTGNIDQQLQYLEMPLEISYSILSTSKAAIMLNTGGFIGKLISNEIFLDGNSIGGNLDVNNFVYGSKLSSTLQYEILKQTRLFVEPGLNYYINPLKTQSFNQFQWGLNFGVNFGF